MGDESRNADVWVVVTLIDGKKGGLMTLAEEFLESRENGRESEAYCKEWAHIETL